MTLYALQHLGTGVFIYGESHFSHTNDFDKALLFKETIIDEKLKQYPGYKAVKYISTGKAVSRY